MKKLLLLIALLLPALFVTAQGIKNGLKEEPKINVGESIRFFRKIDIG